VHFPVVSSKSVGSVDSVAEVNPTQASVRLEQGVTTKFVPDAAAWQVPAFETPPLHV